MSRNQKPDMNGRRRPRSRSLATSPRSTDSAASARPESQPRKKIRNTVTPVTPAVTNDEMIDDSPPLASLPRSLGNSNSPVDPADVEAERISRMLAETACKKAGLPSLNHNGYSAASEIGARPFDYRSRLSELLTKTKDANSAGGVIVKESFERSLLASLSQPDFFTDSNSTKRMPTPQLSSFFIEEYKTYAFSEHFLADVFEYDVASFESESVTMSVDSHGHDTQQGLLRHPFESVLQAASQSCWNFPSLLKQILQWRPKNSDWPSQPLHQLLLNPPDRIALESIWVAFEANKSAILEPIRVPVEEMQELISMKPTGKPETSALVLLTLKGFIACCNMDCTKEKASLLGERLAELVETFYIESAGSLIVKYSSTELFDLNGDRDFFVHSLLRYRDNLKCSPAIARAIMIPLLKAVWKVAPAADHLRNPERNLPIHIAASNPMLGTTITKRLLLRLLPSSDVAKLLNAENRSLAHLVAIYSDSKGAIKLLNHLPEKQLQRMCNQHESQGELPLTIACSRLMRQADLSANLVRFLLQHTSPVIWQDFRDHKEGHSLLQLICSSFNVNPPSFFFSNPDVIVDSDLEKYASRIQISPHQHELHLLQDGNLVGNVICNCCNELCGRQRYSCPNSASEPDTHEEHKPNDVKDCDFDVCLPCMMATVRERLREQVDVQMQKTAVAESSRREEASRVIGMIFEASSTSNVAAENCFLGGQNYSRQTLFHTACSQSHMPDSVFTQILDHFLDSQSALMASDARNLSCLPLVSRYSCSLSLVRLVYNRITAPSSQSPNSELLSNVLRAAVSEAVQRFWLQSELLKTGRKILQFLLERFEHHSNHEERLALGRSLLNKALRFDYDVEMIKLLVPTDCSLEAIPVEYGISPLHIALLPHPWQAVSNHERFGVWEYLLQRLGRHGAQPLLYHIHIPVAEFSLFRETIRCLPPPEQLHGRSMLHLALLFDRCEIVQALVAANYPSDLLPFVGSVIQQRDIYGDLPIHILVKRRLPLPKLFSLLINAFPNALDICNDEGSQPLWCSASCEALIQLFSAKPDVFLHKTEVETREWLRQRPQGSDWLYPIVEEFPSIIAKWRSAHGCTEAANNVHCQTRRRLVKRLLELGAMASVPFDPTNEFLGTMAAALLTPEKQDRRSEPKAWIAKCDREFVSTVMTCMIEHSIEDPQVNWLSVIVANATEEVLSAFLRRPDAACLVDQPSRSTGESPIQFVERTSKQLKRMSHKEAYKLLLVHSSFKMCRPIQFDGRVETQLFGLTGIVYRIDSIGPEMFHRGRRVLLARRLLVPPTIDGRKKLSTSETVIVKSFRSSRRFYAEASWYAEKRVPSTVRVDVLDCCPPNPGLGPVEANERWHLVLQCGEPILSRARPCVSFAVMVVLARSIVSALKKLLENHLVHGNVTISNIVQLKPSEDGAQSSGAQFSSADIRLLDWESCTRLSLPDGPGSMPNAQPYFEATATDPTPQTHKIYMPPEMASLQANLSNTCVIGSTYDIWSLGICWIQLRTGNCDVHPFFHQASRAELCSKLASLDDAHVIAALDQISGLVREEKAILKLLLEVDWSKRIKAAALQDKLEKIISNQSLASSSHETVSVATVPSSSSVRSTKSNIRRSTKSKTSRSQGSKHVQSVKIEVSSTSQAAAAASAINSVNIATITTIMQKPELRYNFRPSIRQDELRNHGDLRDLSTQAYTRQTSPDYVPISIFGPQEDSEFGTSHPFWTRSRAVVFISTSLAWTGELGKWQQASGVIVYVSPDRQIAAILTNNHVLPDIAACNNSEVLFDFIDDSRSECFNARFRPSDCFFTSKDADEELDCTLVAVRLDIKLPREIIPVPLPKKDSKSIITMWQHQPLAVIHHPLQEPKQVSAAGQKLHSAKANRIWYSNGTRKGSSGSPVFDYMWNMVGLHSRFVPARLADDKTLKSTTGPNTPWTTDRPIEELEILCNEGIRAEHIHEWLKNELRKNTSTPQASVILKSIVGER